MPTWAAAMTGRFMLPRSVWIDPTFREEKFSQREAYMWLVSDARWSPGEVSRGHVILALNRGQTAHATRFLATAWHWSEPSVRRYLKKLRDRRMIDTDTDAGITVITIRHYDEYHGSPSEPDAQATREATSTRRVRDANKKKNKIEEGKKEKRRRNDQILDHFVTRSAKTASKICEGDNGDRN